MASATHRKFSMKRGWLYQPARRNEKFVSRVINDLFKQGADVIYEALADIHVSGHALQEELKLIHRLVRPPIFYAGARRLNHLKQHANLAQFLACGRHFLMENGQVLELTQRPAQITEQYNQAISLLMSSEW